MRKELKHSPEEEERRETQNTEGAAQPQRGRSLFWEAGTSRTLQGTNLDYCQIIDENQDSYHLSSTHLLCMPV